MFQFRGFAHLAMCQAFRLTGCPIRISADLISFANPRSFSQLTTSFFASKSLGIPHTPFFTFLLYPDTPFCSGIQPFYLILNYCQGTLESFDSSNSIAVSLCYTLK